jgi:putative ABC transport system permease protein
MVDQASYLKLEYWQVALATLLILVNGALSFALELGLGRRLLIAAGRTTVQLLLIGLVLQKVFALNHWGPVLGLGLIMVLIAGLAAVRRTSRRYPGIWLSSTLSILVSSWVVAGIAVTGVLRVTPWYLPQYAIPFLGMILGNALTGISLGLDRFAETLVRGRDKVDLYLTLGGTRWEAALPAIREAIRTGMIPILNSMTVVGLVSLPGMMTGQLLAGVPPSEAIKYQIVIMFLIASATGLGTVGAVLLSYLKLFNHRHQFLFDNISQGR